MKIYLENCGSYVFIKEDIFDAQIIENIIKILCVNYEYLISLSYNDDDIKGYIRFHSDKESYFYHEYSERNINIIKKRSILTNFKNFLTFLKEREKCQHKQ